MYKQAGSGCAWPECPHCSAAVPDEMGQVFQAQQRAQTGTHSSLAAAGAARASWGGERGPLCPTKHCSSHQMIYFLVTLYLMISWAGILNALSIV